ncbi:NAD-dependent protein deacetylase of SIR2 family [hydrothermal vent metagenome]|uniref:NAD-dependent protein deacetylase of SIR2 family n=1 Tax=hydrothermal vent metagenome TaxID=652676 RepID=A0A3B0R371_9ZZZZ
MQGDTEGAVPEQAFIPDRVLIEDLQVRLARARKVAVLSGAGISAESGVPTFRGSGGLWQGRRAEELATPEAFNRDPKLVWEFYDYRRRALSELSPNPAHIALAGLAEKLIDRDAKEGGLTIITQNVDGLHRSAGSKALLELHGNIWRVRCTGCGAVTENRDVPIEILPYCRLSPCKELLRPDIVWFGEMLPEGIFEEACRVAAAADIMLIIGTSGVVQPAASLAGYARAGGAYLIEINPEKTPLSESMDQSITAKAAQLLPLII